MRDIGQEILDGIEEIKEIRIDTYTDSSKWVDIRMTHEPTGLSVKGHASSQYFLRKSLLMELRGKISNLKEAQHQLSRDLE